MCFFLKRPSIHDSKGVLPEFFISLRKNPPEVRLTNGQKLSTEIIYIVFEIFLLNNSKYRKQVRENALETRLENKFKKRLLLFIVVK